MFEKRHEKELAREHAEQATEATEATETDDSFIDADESVEADEEPE